jgi:hypothetical protein
MGLQAAVHLGHMPWALTKEEDDVLETCRELKIKIKINTQ